MCKQCSVVWNKLKWSGGKKEGRSDLRQTVIDLVSCGSERERNTEPDEVLEMVTTILVILL